MQSFESVCKDGMAVPGLFFTDPVRRRRERVRGIESCGVMAVGRNYRYIKTAGESKRRGHGNTCCRDLYRGSRLLGTRRNGSGYIEQEEARGRGRESIKAEGNPRERQTAKATSTQRNEWHEADAKETKGEYKGKRETRERTGERCTRR